MAGIIPVRTKPFFGEKSHIRRRKPIIHGLHVDMIAKRNSFHQSIFNTVEKTVEFGKH